MPKTFYLAAGPDGRVPTAEQNANPGALLTLATPPAPFKPKALWAAPTPAGALGAPHANWPCRLFEVTGAPRRGTPYKDSDVRAFDQLTVIDELDPALALGAAEPALTRLFAALGAMRLGDLRAAPSAEERWSQQHPDADPDQSPSFLALTHAGELAQRNGLRAVRRAATDHAKALAKNAAAGMFDLRQHREYDAYVRDLEDAVYLATSAATVAHLLDETRREQLTCDLRALTAISAA